MNLDGKYERRPITLGILLLTSRLEVWSVLSCSFIGRLNGWGLGLMVHAKCQAVGIHSHARQGTNTHADEVAPKLSRLSRTLFFDLRLGIRLEKIVHP